MYQTRRRSSSGLRRSSRVDRRKTRVGILGYLKDSDDSASDTADNASDTADTASDSADSASGNVVHSNSDNAGDRRDKEQPAGSASDEEDACATPRAGRKRSFTAVLADSSSSSDSDEVGQPVRKVLPKKRLNLQTPLSDSDEEEEGDAARPEREKEKKRERRDKLLELSRRTRARAGRSVRGTTEVPACALHYNTACDTHTPVVQCFEMRQLEYFQGISVFPRCNWWIVVFPVMTDVSNAADGVRTKRYACKMKNSLDHLDQRSVIPRLVNLKQRSRWSERYKERVECYPNVKILSIGRFDRTCEACQLHRNTRFCVRLSGQLYDDKTLQEDTFMLNDTQDFRVGVVCANRTEVYHQLKHFKYHLFRQCKAELEKEEEAPVKDMVSKAFSRLRACGWIRQQYEEFEGHLNKADYFQEEKLDF
uniref:Coiled-coil domain containing 82 n=1 Tax=Paramormyrops kingsleyae TaxID=1676925 RepID=A0A3B3Q4M9_9TELE